VLRRAVCRAAVSLRFALQAWCQGPHVPSQDIQIWSGKTLASSAPRCSVCLLCLTTRSLPFQVQGCVNSLEKTEWAQQLCHVTLFVLKSTWRFGHSKKPEGLRMIINKSRVTSWRWAVLGKASKTRSKSFNMTLQQVSYSASPKRIMN